MTNDRATIYAKRVASGEILAGPYVKGACQRHLDDLEHGHERGLWFDPEEAAESIAFFEEVLCLNGGQFEGKPFLLMGWQSFVVGSLFGWKREDNTRRFRVAYIETPKGSGKSPLCAGIGLKGLVADNEPRAEIYAAATFKNQAMVLFRDALAFFDQSPGLQDRLIASGKDAQRWNLAYTAKSSFFRVISSEKKGQSGPRPHMALLDEIHEHRDGTVIELLRAGFKFRRQPLSVMITNSGHDKTSVCWEYHEMGAKIACQQLDNDAFFAYICSLDDADLEDDAFLDDENLWSKVNPSLQEANIPGYNYIREQIKEAKGMPSKMSTVKRLCFCLWTEADNPWIGSDVWMGCKDDEFDETLLDNRTCYGGLDLSSVNDLSSLVLLFEPTKNDPLWRLLPYFWTPGDGLKAKSEMDHVPYDAWRDKGFLFALPGKSIKKGAVVKKMHDVCLKYNVLGIAYDRQMMGDLIEIAEKEGIDLSLGQWDKDKKEWIFDNSDGIKLLPFGQESRSMHPAIEKFESMLKDKEIRHNGNPVLTWNVANAVDTKDENEYRKLSKRKSSGRIDGAVASIMACGISGSLANGDSIYESRGVISI
jgi:phage terminase large subunit-like protein